MRPATTERIVRMKCLHVLTARGRRAWMVGFVFPGLIESLSLAQTVGLADWVSLPNPHSCRYRGTNPSSRTLLEGQFDFHVS